MEVKYDVSGIVHEQSVSLRQISNFIGYGKDGAVYQKH